MNKTSALVVASAGAFVAALSTGVVAVSLPVIARDLGVTLRDASLVLSAYLLAVSCLLPLSGRASDVLGQKRVFSTGALFFVAGSAMCATAPSFGALVGARLLQGVGASMFMAVGPALVTRAFAPGEKARALGFQLAATYTGLTLGPTVGGALATHGWRAIFLVVACGGVVAGVIAIVLLDSDEPRNARRPSLDVVGAALFAAGLAGAIVALRRAPSDGWASPSVVTIAALSVLAFVLFARNESRHPAPLLSPTLAKAPPFALGILGALLMYLTTTMLSFLLPFHLQHELAMSPGRTGLFMTAQPVTMALIAPASGFVADRFGARAPLTIGMALLAFGLYFVGRAANLGGAPLVLALALVGAGAGFYVAPNNATIMGAAPRERQGTAAAMAATARNVGMTCGVAIAASLEHPLGLRRSLLVAAALAGVGALLGVLRPVLPSHA